MKYTSSMEKLIRALLTDENGICEEAFNALYEYLETAAYQKMTAREANRLLALVKSASATDGRFYFDWDECDACNGQGTTGGTPDSGASPCDVCNGSGTI